jgi:hypothetical protein
MKSPTHFSSKYLNQMSREELVQEVKDMRGENQRIQAELQTYREFKQTILTVEGRLEVIDELLEMNNKEFGVERPMDMEEQADQSSESSPATLRDYGVFVAGLVAIIGICVIAASSTSPFAKAVVFGAAAYYGFYEHGFKWRPKVASGLVLVLAAGAIFGTLAGSGLIPRPDRSDSGDDDYKVPLSERLKKYGIN